MIADMDSSRAHSSLSRKKNCRVVRDFRPQISDLWHRFLLTSRAARVALGTIMGVKYIAHEFLDNTQGPFRIQMYRPRRRVHESQA
jgi:hypothetical protein